MDQRRQFVTDALSDRFTMTELCERLRYERPWTASVANGTPLSVRIPNVW